MDTSRQLVFTAVLVFMTAATIAKDPDCTHPDRWPSAMAQGHLKSAGLLDPQFLDFDKTSVRLLASQKIGKDLYRQIHLVTVQKKTGEKISAITVNEVSHVECSMSNVDVYLVAQKLGDYTNPK
jgi:hypothetical protein